MADGSTSAALEARIGPWAVRPASSSSEGFLGAGGRGTEFTMSSVAEKVVERKAGRSDRGMSEKSRGERACREVCRADMLAKIERLCY